MLVEELGGAGGRLGRAQELEGLRGVGVERLGSELRGVERGGAELCTLDIGCARLNLSELRRSNLRRSNLHRGNLRRCDLVGPSPFFLERDEHVRQWHRLMIVGAAGTRRCCRGLCRARRSSSSANPTSSAKAPQGLWQPVWEHSAHA
ncbi:pentapeptide repeat-containing protein [Leucobacter luti]|uniref:pentapeptide repeat-containing protein n=1 Tax=Leucobacter luti TaxID=340320 RepID=UPI0039B52CC1